MKTLLILLMLATPATAAIYQVDNDCSVIYVEGAVTVSQPSPMVCPPPKDCADATYVQSLEAQLSNLQWTLDRVCAYVRSLNGGVSPIRECGPGMPD